MKIMMVSDSYPPRIGGMERYVLSLSKELARRGHSVTVCTTPNRFPTEAEEIEGVRVIRCSGLFDRFPFLSSNRQEYWPPPIPDPLLTRALQRAISEVKPDVINVHGWVLFSLLPLKKKLTAPIVATLHSYMFICPKTIFLRYGKVCHQPFTQACVHCSRDTYNAFQAPIVYPCVKLQRNKLGQADQVISVSSFVRDVHLKSLGLPPQKVVTIPNFAAPSAAVSASAADLPDDFILFVGLLSPFKGVDVLVDAFNKMNTTTKLVLIGKKSPERSYKTSKNIVVFENAPGALVKEAYRRCRFTVVPSVMPDPCPTVAFEAMAAGKAIVASSIGGLTDIVEDEETGLLFPPNDLAALRKALEKLCRDHGLAEQMGKMGEQRFLQKFDIDVVVSKIEAFYHSLLSKELKTPKVLGMRERESG